MSSAAAAASGAQAAVTVGGSRTAASNARRRNVPSSSSNSTSAPRPRHTVGSQGLLRFYTDDAPGLKVGPQTVLVLTLIFMASVVVLHIFAKFRQAMES